MLRAFTLAALLAATAAPAFAQKSAPMSNSMGSSAAPAPSSSATASGAATASTTPTAPSPVMIKMMQTCKADFAKACPNMAPASPEMRTCVQTNFSTLGEPCQGAIMEMVNAGGAG